MGAGGWAPCPPHFNHCRQTSSSTTRLYCARFWRIQFNGLRSLAQSLNFSLTAPHVIAYHCQSDAILSKSNSHQHCHVSPMVKVVLWRGGGAHLTKPGCSRPHIHSTPTNLALFGHKITLYRFQSVPGPHSGGPPFRRSAIPGVRVRVRVRVRVNPSGPPEWWTGND